jgi:hypothetical protein
MSITVVRFVLKDPSVFDILRYFTIFPVPCVRFLIHFSFSKITKVFAKIFVIFVTFCKLFSRNAKINYRKIFAKIRTRKFSFQP